MLKDKYEGVTTIVHTVGDDTRDFPILVGLHQGSAVSLYFFTLVLDELMKHI